MQRILLYTCFFLFCLKTAFAQKPSFNVYTPADGLTDARVHSIFQDSRGVLYFLARDGFCSFDGQRFQQYTQHRDQPISIVYDIAEEKDGSLLIAAYSGLYRLRQQQLSKDTALGRIIREPGHIIAAGPDEWYILAADGTYLYSNGKAQQLRITENGRTAQPLLLDHAVRSGTWLAGIRNRQAGSPQQLVIYNRQTNQLHTPVVAENPVEVAQYDNRIYLKSNGTWSLLRMPTGNGSTVVTEPLPFAAGENVSRFYTDSDSITWLFNRDMTVTYMRKSTSEQEHYTAADGFPVSAVKVFRDREHNYWFMVEGKGVYKLVQSTVKLFQPAIISGPVQSLCNTPDNGVCLRSNDNVFFLKGDQVIRQKTNQQQGLIQSLFLHNKWYFFFANGTLRTSDGNSIRFAAFPEGTRQVSSHICFDKKGRILTAGDFIAVIDHDSLITTEPLPYFTDNIAVDDNNDYWCFTRNGTITVYTLNGNKLLKKNTFADQTFSTRFALHWNKDSFFIGTRNHGVIIATASDKGYRKLNTISTAQGLSNNFITGLLSMGPGQLIASTVTGLDRIQFTREDTITEQLFSRTGMFTGVPALVNHGNSALLALTDRGELYRYTAGLKNGPAEGPSLFLNAVLVNSRPVDTSGPVTLPYNRNNLRFIVSAPGFIDEKNIRFYFSINGEPVAGGTANRTGEAEFTNLLPGHYTVTVTALFPGSTAARKTIRYSFTIKKPFWKTTGFIAALTALIMLLIYSIFRIQLRRKLQRQQIELEKEKAIAGERSRIASDMHDDLGAGISTIKYLSQSAPFIAPEIQKENSKKIAAQADALVDKMNDIIWAMNEKNDTLDNLIFYTKAWVANYLEPFQKNVLTAIPSHVPPFIIRGEKRQHIFLCVKEAVHNIIKHADASTIWLNISLEDHTLQITIKDDGRGFDTGKSGGGNGLSNMRKRMKAVNGTITMTSTPGTEIVLSIPV